MVDSGLAMADAEAQPHSLDGSVPRRRRTETRRRDLGSLSGDVVGLVLALLPFPEVYRLRSVCKRWDALIRRLPCGTFHSPRVGWMGHGSRAVPWFAYDLSDTTMRKTTMPQLEFPECARKAHWHLFDAGGGLLCFGALEAWGGRRRILICNPMTKAWRELPNVSLDSKASAVYSTCWEVVTHIVVDDCRSSYKILFAGAKGVDLYDSAANKWSAAERLSPEMSFQSGAYCNGEMYLLGKMVSSGPYMVMILELATLTWREDTIPMPATCVKYPNIVSWSGEVYLVVESSEITILLFRLNPGGRWSRVSEYANHAGGIYGCGAHGGRIFVVTREWIAVYNCPTGVWEETVKETFFHMKDVYETKFAFQPNLVAAP